MSAGVQLTDRTLLEKARARRAAQPITSIPDSLGAKLRSLFGELRTA